MANRDTPFGLRLYNQSSDHRMELVLIPATDSNAYGVGDAVKTAGSAGRIGKGPIVKTVAIVAAGDAIYGVIQGFLKHEVAASSFNLDSKVRVASVATYAMIHVANHQDVYEIQADDEGSTLAAADIGLNANLTGNGGGTTITAPNSSTGMSTILLDTSTKNTTATLQVKIIGPVDREDNEAYAADGKYLVRLNNIEVSGGTGTAGV